MFLFASSCSFDKEIEKPTQPLSNEVSEIKTWYEENYSNLHVSSQNEESKRSIKGKNDSHQILWNFDRKELLKSGKKFFEFPVTREFYSVPKLSGFANHNWYPLAEKIIFVPSKEQYTVYFLKYFSEENISLDNSYGLNKFTELFSGFISLHDQQGNLLRLYKYLDGKLDSKGFLYVPTGNKNLLELGNSRVMSESCTDITLEWDENTVTWDPEENAWAPTVIGHTETIQICFTNFGGGGSGDGGGGGGIGNGDSGGPGDDIDAGSDGSIIDYFTRRDPCRHAKALANEPNFRTNFESLQNLTSENFEGYYLLSKVGDQYSYAYGEGPANSGEASFNSPHPISGYLHSHYGTGTLPIFSLTDVQALYLTAIQNRLDVSIQEAVIGVVTGHGTNYILKVNDPSKFLSFGADNLENDSDLEDLEVIYNSFFLIYSNFSNNNIIRHELAFLKTLENAGLVLLKGNSQFSSYQKLSLNGNTVSSINC